MGLGLDANPAVFPIVGTKLGADGCGDRRTVGGGVSVLSLAPPNLPAPTRAATTVAAVSAADGTLLRVESS